VKKQTPLAQLAAPAASHLPGHWIHYTGGNFSEVDVTQVFRMEILKHAHKIRHECTRGRWLMSNCIRIAANGPGDWEGRMAAVGKRLHTAARNVFFHTHELPTKQKAIILLSCSLERPHVDVALCALLSKKRRAYRLIGVNKTRLGAMVA
jgi:hypothetical protein